MPHALQNQIRLQKNDLDDALFVYLLNLPEFMVGGLRTTLQS